MVRKLSWIGHLESYETIITENPIDEIWHLIDFFTSEETIAECNPPVDSDLLPFISESIVQAQEFRQSASTSGEHTKPLLTYYSIHNLTKALLALETNQKPSGYHGLMRVKLPADGNFLGVSAQLNDGVFCDLLQFNKIATIKNFKITVNDLISRCGYLIREYRLAYGKQSDVIIPKVSADMGLNELELTFKKIDNIENNWMILFPKLAEHFELVDSSSEYANFKSRPTIPKGKLEDIQKVINDVLIRSIFMDSCLFLLPITNHNLQWPQEAYLYALSFILGSLVRYYPDYWHKHIVGHKRNRWVIRKINSIVERVYPNLMLNIMYNNKFYKFSSSSAVL
jgi:hypothetical protein